MNNKDFFVVFTENIEEPRGFHCKYIVQHPTVNMNNKDFSVIFGKQQEYHCTYWKIEESFTVLMEDWHW